MGRCLAMVTSFVFGDTINATRNIGEVETDLFHFQERSG
jgi:hypothetical protein